MEDASAKKDRDHSETLGELRRRRSVVAERRSRVQRIYYTALGLGVTMVVFAPFFMWRLPSTSSMSTFGPMVLLYAAAPLAMAPTFRMRLRDVEADLQEIEFQIDLQQFEVGKEESRAEKVLRINEFQLRRYYDMNLSQNLWVFGLGVLCMILGVSVILVSLYLVLSVAATTEAKVIVASLGAVGSVLTNVVAAVYLRMNASASQNLATFHSGLVDMHQLLLANLLASRIENAEQRWNTLAALATGLTGKKKGTAPNLASEPTAREERVRRSRSTRISPD